MSRSAVRLHSDRLAVTWRRGAGPPCVARPRRAARCPSQGRFPGPSSKASAPRNYNCCSSALIRLSNPRHRHLPPVEMCRPPRSLHPARLPLRRPGLHPDLASRRRRGHHRRSAARPEARRRQVIERMRVRIRLVRIRHRASGSTSAADSQRTQDDGAVAATTTSQTLPGCVQLVGDGPACVPFV
jgi:hypothetical protein